MLHDEFLWSGYMQLSPDNKRHNLNIMLCNCMNLEKSLKNCNFNNQSKIFGLQLYL